MIFKLDSYVFYWFLISYVFLCLLFIRHFLKHYETKAITVISFHSFPFLILLCYLLSLLSECIQLFVNLIDVFVLCTFIMYYLIYVVFCQWRPNFCVFYIDNKIWIWIWIWIWIIPFPTTDFFITFYSIFRYSTTTSYPETTARCSNKGCVCRMLRWLLPFPFLNHLCWLSPFHFLHQQL